MTTKQRFSEVGTLFPIRFLFGDNVTVNLLVELDHTMSPPLQVREILVSDQLELNYRELQDCNHPAE